MAFTHNFHKKKYPFRFGSFVLQNKRMSGTLTDDHPEKGIYLKLVSINRLQAMHLNAMQRYVFFRYLQNLFFDKL